MKIIIDIMGGDNAPKAPVEAAVKAAKNMGVEIILVGREEVAKTELSKYTYPEDKIEIVDAREVITNYEEPAKALRKKRNSSIAVAARLLKEGKGDALLSMGSTGALLSAGLLIVGRIRGIIRPALGAVLPSEKGPVLLLDAGANTKCKRENMVQFAVMGSIYMNKIMSVKNPVVGLMSNGEEESKGNELVKLSYSLLEEAPINFRGNIEGRDVMLGNADVIVCDGFVGNVILKTVEGMGSFVGRALKNIFKKNIITKLGALLVLPGVNRFKSSMDYREYGGAPLLGVRGTVIKGHGSSDAKAIYSAIGQAVRAVETDVTGEIKRSLPEIEINEEEI